ncbi:unnamed protein product, partial [Meganyctiphanes norvegica]
GFLVPQQHRMIFTLLTIASGLISAETSWQYIVPKALGQQPDILLNTPQSKNYPDLEKNGEDGVGIISIHNPFIPHNNDLKKKIESTVAQWKDMVSGVGQLGIPGQLSGDGQLVIPSQLSGDGQLGIPSQLSLPNESSQSSMQIIEDNVGLIGANRMGKYPPDDHHIDSPEYGQLGIPSQLSQPNESFQSPIQISEENVGLFVANEIGKYPPDDHHIDSPEDGQLGIPSQLSQPNESFQSPMQISEENVALIAANRRGKYPPDGHHIASPPEQYPDVQSRFFFGGKKKKEHIYVTTGDGHFYYAGSSGRKNKAGNKGGSGNQEEEVASQRKSEKIKEWFTNKFSKFHDKGSYSGHHKGGKGKSPQLIILESIIDSGGDNSGSEGNGSGGGNGGSSGGNGDSVIESFSGSDSGGSNTHRRCTGFGGSCGYKKKRGKQSYVAVKTGSADWGWGWDQQSQGHRETPHKIQQVTQGSQYQPYFGQSHYVSNGGNMQQQSHVHIVHHQGHEHGQGGGTEQDKYTVHGGGPLVSKDDSGLGRVSYISASDQQDNGEGDDYGSSSGNQGSHITLVHTGDHSDQSHSHVITQPQVIVINEGHGYTEEGGSDSEKPSFHDLLSAKKEFFSDGAYHTKEAISNLGHGVLTAIKAPFVLVKELGEKIIGGVHDKMESHSEGEEEIVLVTMPEGSMNPDTHPGVVTIVNNDDQGGHKHLFGHKHFGHYKHW